MWVRNQVLTLFCIVDMFLDVIPILSKCYNMEVNNDEMLIYSCCDSYAVKCRNVI
jgi:hypothetical protein